MVAYTDDELEGMLLDIESDLVERKATFAGSAPEKARQAVCAFANDLPGHDRPGVVFVGARDDGAPENLDITDRLLQQLTDMKTDGRILPPPTLTVEKRTLRGAAMAVVTVTPSDAPPVRYEGRTWIRIGPRRGLATAQDERILNEKRRHGDRPYDTHPIRAASLADLDRLFFEETYLPAAVARDVLAANDRSYEQRLAATRMISAVDDPVPSVLGLLVLGRRTRDFLPGAYIQFLRIAGGELSDPILDEQAIDGPMHEVLRRIDDKLVAHNRTAVDITTGSLEARREQYPMSALQQLVRNAVLHRTYEATNAPVRVTWFDDRIEIQNPGGPYGAVGLENFGEPGVVDYRNPGLAEALRTLGFVQRFGAGIAIARAALQKNGNPPLEFRVEPNWVAAILRAAS